MKHYLIAIISVFSIVITNAWAYDFPKERSISPEWEKQRSVWLQWPTDHNTEVTKPILKIINSVQFYQPVNIIINSEKDKGKAQRYLLKNAIAEENISWYEYPTGNSYWLRDHGPIYVSGKESTWVQNWKYSSRIEGNEKIDEKDNQTPKHIAKDVNLRFEDYTDYILSRSNIETNGKGTAIINWTLQKQENKNLGLVEHEELLKKALGLDNIIWAYQYIADGKATPIDQIARFINKNTVVVRKSSGVMRVTEESVAKALRNKGFKVVRYSGSVNWLVGNGFLLAASSNSKLDKKLEKQLQGLFPKHNIHLINVSSLQKLHGGIHSVTSDQPL